MVVFDSRARSFEIGFVDVGYVGNKSTNLIVFADYNEALPKPPGENLSIQARRPNQAFGAITVTWPGAFANYHAFQAKLERQFSEGFYLLNSFVCSKAIDNTGQALEAQGSGGRASPQSFYNLRAEKAVSDFDQTLNNTLSLVYELPFGKGRKHLSNLPAVADHLLGGWQFNIINNLWSGEPLNLSYTPALAFQVSQAAIPDWRGGISYRPNLVGPILTPEGQRNIDNYLNRASVQVPTDASQPFGNAGRNVARSYPALSDRLRFGEELSTAARRHEPPSSEREAFNLFNRTNFRNANTNASSAAFGQVRATFPARQVQFGLRLVVSAHSEDGTV